LFSCLSRRISRENTNYRYAVFKVRTGRVPVGERKRHLPAKRVSAVRPSRSLEVSRSLKAQQHEPHSGEPGRGTSRRERRLRAGGWTGSTKLSM